MVVVNDFVLRAKHGDEYCLACYYDHRFTNSVQIEDKIDDNLKENYSMDERPSFNVYSHGAIRIDPSGESCKCRERDKIDYESCFNWLAFVKGQATQAQRDAAWLESKQKWYDKMGQ
ncbi:hypothetical protein CPC08DRAFT_638973 [Agrocybe pediades]|nr:hypothetical protein CPC08DRAFT_638973 [Agrocybe pediades]